MAVSSGDLLPPSPPPRRPPLAKIRPGRPATHHQRLPGPRYALAALEALAAIALNSAPVQALAVVTSEIVPAAAAAINAAMMLSASLASEMSRKSESPVVKGPSLHLHDTYGPARAIAALRRGLNTDSAETADLALVLINAQIAAPLFPNCFYPIPVRQPS